MVHIYSFRFQRIFLLISIEIFQEIDLISIIGLSCGIAETIVLWTN